MNDSPDPRSPGRSDDELGAALGHSVRGRADDIPTITPGFDGVERRARQITNRRRALAGVAVGAFLLLGGVGVALLAGGDDDAVDQDTVDQPDDAAPPDGNPPAPSTTLPPPESTVTSPTAPTTTAEPIVWPVDLNGATPPALVIADGTSVVHYQPNADGSLDDAIVVERATENPVTDVHQASNGDVFVSEVTNGPSGQDVSFFARYGFNGGRTELDVAAIYDVAVVNGVESVIVALPSIDGLGFGGVQAWAVDDLRLVADFGLEAEAEFGVTDFHWNVAAELGVATAWSDLTEWVGFVDADGTAAELPSPTDDLDYNAPPYVTAATISPDVTTLYWAEGPDWGFDPETNESGPIADSWVLHGADLTSGETVLSITLGEPVPGRSALDVASIVPFDDYIIVNRTTGFGADLVALAPLVVDFTGDEPELYEYPVAGIATASAIG